MSVDDLDRFLPFLHFHERENPMINCRMDKKISTQYINLFIIIITVSGQRPRTVPQLATAHIARHQNA
jgi:branched-subunit amino acid transport protein AzlD